MPCRVSTGHFLVRNKPWFIVGRSSKSKLVRSRRLNTIDLEEQTAPWDTSWLKCDLQHKGHAALPKSGDISLKSPRKAFLNHGVSIDNRGQLTVNSRTHAEKECRTALILSAASTHLTKADFTRLLPENDSLGEHGFEAAIPGRHAQTLQRLPYWIVLFRTPYLAASYQSHLRWCHQNAVENLPVNPLQAALIPGRGLTPPPGYIDPESGENVWKRLHQYCILQPAQNFSVTALLPKFPLSIKQAIQRYERWNAFYGARSWIVLIRVDGGQWKEEEIFRFLREDGKRRKRSWDVVYHEPASVSGHEHSGQAQSSPVTRMTVFEDNSGGLKAGDLQTFGVQFHSEGEAMRFWRTWHRRPFPGLAENASPSDQQSLLLHVELTW